MKKLEGVNKSGAEPYFFVSHASADNHRLKPVIERLLELGVPLWFDKPSDLGLSNELFAGHIPTGGVWTKELHLAVGGARGLIYFPSENYQKSRECCEERALASGLTTLTERKFMTTAIFLGDDAFEYADARTANNQGAKAYTREMDGAWVLPAEYEIAVGNMAMDLKNALSDKLRQHDVMLKMAGGWTQRDEAEGSAERAEPRNYIVPYRVDRSPQRDMVRDSHFEFLDTREAGEAATGGGIARRPIFVCHGDSVDASRHFIKTTLAGRLVQEAPHGFSWAEQTPETLRPRWPEGAYDEQDRFNRGFTNNLIEKFQNVAVGRGPVSTDQLADAFRTNNVTRFVASQIIVEPEEETLKSVKAKLANWAGFWNAFPFDRSDCDAHFTVIPILEIIYTPSAIKRGGLFSRRSRAQQLEAFFDGQGTASELTRSYGAIKVNVLKRLQKIKPSLIARWFSDDRQMFAGLDEFDRLELQNELEDIFSANPEMAMEDWFAQSRAALWKAGIGV